MLAGWDDFRTLRWLDYIKFPQLMLQQTQELLAIAV